MKSSNTSSWESNNYKQFSGRRGISEQALITTSTRELVEFYWSNRKRFSGSYGGFPVKTKRQGGKVQL
mgnify:CR=1 FL=1